MTVTLVFGAQWGDEGKGKAIDFLAERCDISARYNGGNNAGHTVVNPHGTFKMHLIPCGVFYDHVTCLMGNGMVIDPAVLLHEMDELRRAGVNFTGRLFLSPRAHLIMPYHKLLDGLYEEAKGAGATGTTRRGIGPAFADKVSYNGLRFSDLADPDRFAAKLRVQLNLKNKLITAFGGQAFSFDPILAEYREYYQQLCPYIHELFPIVQDGLKHGKHFLLEQAMGSLLDADLGTYPFVTASSTLASAATPGLGIPPRELTRVIGAAKAYTTRVGAGPLPTEILGDSAEDEAARSVLAETAATTGRSRRAGWLDLEVLRFTAFVNGATDLFVAKLDVLSAFREIKVCVGYELDGKPVRYYDVDAYGLGDVKPIYRSLPGWERDITKARKYADLPASAQAYVAYIEQEVGVRVGWVSVGPEREATIER
jgi:adenylosuccinate synthase